MLDHIISLYYPWYASLHFKKEGTVEIRESLLTTLKDSRPQGSGRGGSTSSGAGQQRWPDARSLGIFADMKQGLAQHFR